MSDFAEGVNPLGDEEENKDLRKLYKILVQLMDMFDKSTKSQFKTASASINLEQALNRATKSHNDNFNFEKGLLNNFTQEQQNILEKYTKQIEKLKSEITLADHLLRETHSDAAKMKEYYKWILDPKNRKRAESEQASVNKEYTENMRKYQDRHLGAALSDYMLDKNPLIKLLLKKSEGPGSARSIRESQRQGMKKPYQQESEDFQLKDLEGFETGDMNQADKMRLKRAEERRLRRERADALYKFDLKNQDKSNIPMIYSRPNTYIKSNKNRGKEKYSNSKPKKSGYSDLNLKKANKYLPRPTENQVAKFIAKPKKNRGKEKYSKAKPSESDLVKLPENYGLPALYLGEILEKQFGILDADSKELSQDESNSKIKGLLDPSNLAGLGLPALISSVLPEILSTVVPALAIALGTAGIIALIVSIFKGSKDTRDLPTAGQKAGNEALAKGEAGTIDLNAAGVIDNTIGTGSGLSEVHKLQIAQRDIDTNAKLAVGDYTKGGYYFWVDKDNQYWTKKDILSTPVKINIPSPQQKADIIRNWGLRNPDSKLPGMGIDDPKKGFEIASSDPNTKSSYFDTALKTSNGKPLQFDNGGIVPNVSGVVPGPYGMHIPILAQSGENVQTKAQVKESSETSEAVANNTATMSDYMKTLVDINTKLLSEMQNNTKATERSSTSDSGNSPQASRKFVSMVQ
jgi:hypothetical protein